MTSETGKITYDDGTETLDGKNDGGGIDETATWAQADGDDGWATDGAWQLATWLIETIAKFDGNETDDGKTAEADTTPGIEICVAGTMIVLYVE